MIFSRKYRVYTDHPIKMHIVGIKWEPQVIKIAPSLARKGWGNGYVRLPRDHKYFGTNYNDIPYEAHGGLTYSGLEKYQGKEYWVIGFDSAHYGDSDLIKKRHIAQYTRELQKQAIEDYDLTNNLMNKISKLENAFREKMSNIMDIFSK